jgi:hypothetical protein
MRISFDLSALNSSISSSAVVSLSKMSSSLTSSSTQPAQLSFSSPASASALSTSPNIRWNSVRETKQFLRDSFTYIPYTAEMESLRDDYYDTEYWKMLIPVEPMGTSASYVVAFLLLILFSI